MKTICRRPRLLFVLIPVTVFIFNSCTLKPEEENEDEEKENLAFTIKEEFLQEFEKTKDPYTNSVPRERLLQASDQVKQFFSKDNAISGINWVERGPSNVGGRTRAIIFDKNDASKNTIFAGGVAGGIWKSSNINVASPTWTKISDVLDNIAISCIVQDQSTPSVMYLGSGEVWGNLDAQRGLGIWKSTDGGASWNHLASTTSSQFNYVQNIVLTSYAVFAATASGIQKSADGGNSWTTVLINSISDIQLAANGDIYASNFLGNIYKTTTAQQGAAGTWTNVSVPGSHQRIKLATAPSDANKVYAVCQGAGSQEVDAIYRSDNGGTSWNVCVLPTLVDQSTSSTLTRGQAWYDLAAAVDPNNANVVIVAGIDAVRSTNGGTSWTQITAWALPSPGFVQTVHSDQHIILFSPGSSSIAVWGCDGGIYYTSNVNVTPSKPTFVNVNNGYNVTQFYAGDIAPTAGATYFLAGAQDNGSQKFAGGGGIQSTTSASGGDGAFCHIDQADPTKQYTSYVYSVYYRSINSGTSFIQKINDQTHGSFINPSDHDDNSKILYSDYTTVSTRAGGSYARWTTTGTINTGVSVPNFSGASVTNVYVSPNVSNRVYFGLANGSVVYVNNANAATNGTGSTIIKTGVGSVSGIAIEIGNENHILVTYSNYGVTSVWETTNGGTIWTSVEGNLPDMPVRWVIFNPNDYDQALLATELGVWSTDNLNGTSTLWAPTNAGLANTRVDMLKLRTSDKTVVAATHGRGLFTTTFTNIVLPTVYFEKSNVSVAENGGTVNACNLGTTVVPVKLYLSAPATAPVTVQVDVAPNSTASNLNDYTIASNTVTFPTGTTGPQTVNVTVKDDNSFEGNEYINLAYSITAGGTVATKGTTLQNFEIEIADNETGVSTANINMVNSGAANTNLGGSSPVQGSQTDKKTQYLYSASDLLANGLKAGNITDISFIVNTKASTAAYNGFTFKVGATAAADLSAGFVTPAIWKTITSGNYSTIFGVNQFTIPGGFTWDGASNLVFEFCYDNSTASADDILSGEATTYISQAKKATTGVPADAGCTFTGATATNTYRPVLTFTQIIPQTGISTVLNSTKQASLKGNDKVYFFDASGKIMASIQNDMSFDYGCTSVTIDRAGTGATAFIDNTPADYLVDKTFRVIPTTNNPSGQYTITLYYTQAEKNGWEAATGNLWSNIMLVKTNGAISSATPGSPGGAGTIEYAIPVHGTLGADYTLSYTFNTGFSGFGAGIVSSTLPVSLLNLNGVLQNQTVFLRWNTSTQSNTRYFEIQKSLDGNTYGPIGKVMSNGGSRADYSYTDLQVESINYYRLRIVDADNRSTFSNIIIIKVPGLSQKIYVLKNPFANAISLRFAYQPKEKILLSLFDISGKKIVSKEFKAESILQWNGFNSLANGVYLLEAYVDRTRFIYKILKN